MKKKILIMGLPGAGKTTLAKKLVSLTNAVWLNADDIRRKNNDWDFSNEGRLRQAKRMANLADKFKKDGTLDRRYKGNDVVCSGCNRFSAKIACPGCNIFFHTFW